jgi:broad specificity phosphatase PhoE
MAKEVDRFVELVVVRHGETSWNASRIVQVGSQHQASVALSF